MKALALLILMSSTLAAISQANSPSSSQPVPQAGPQPQGDIFDSSLNGRVWANQALGISWTIPKGLHPRQEQEKAMKNKAQMNPQGVASLLKEWEQHDAQDREQGILLRGDDHDPQTLGMDHSETNTARAMRNNYNVPTLGAPPAAQRTFLILAQQLRDPKVSSSELLRNQTEQMHAQNPALEIQLASEPETFAGMSFAHADWVRKDKTTNNERQYFRSFVTTHNGYELAFTFRAESAKSLDKLSESMQSLALVDQNPAVAQH